MKLLTLFAILFAISLISATSISPNQIDVTTQVNINSTYNFVVNNTNNFTIFDFSFPLLQTKGFKFPNISVPANTSQQFSVTVNTNSSFYGTIEEKVEFKFYVNLPEEVTTYRINITENGFSETYKTIRNGDTIIWENKDDITHNIFSAEFGTLSIPVNSTRQYTFTNIGLFHYYDTYFNIFSNFNGNIEVVNRTEQQKVHNPNYDFSWFVNLNSISNPTTISILNSKVSHTIVYGNLSKGLITVENIGNEDAEGIKITSNYNWLTFEKNDFTINKGDTDWIEYQILPNSLTTNDTDKNYTIELSIKARNSEQKNLSINVFIPYKEISGNIENDFDYAMWLQNTWCPSHPCSVQCNPELPQCVSSGSGNGSSGLEIEANLSKIDLYNLMKDIAKMSDSTSRSDNSIKELADKYGLTTPELMQMLNQSIALQVRNEKKVKSTNETAWILGFLTLLTILIIFTINRVYKERERKKRVGSAYEYKP